MPSRGIFDKETRRKPLAFAANAAPMEIECQFGTFVLTKMVLEAARSEFRGLHPSPYLNHSRSSERVFGEQSMLERAELFVRAMTKAVRLQLRQAPQSSR